MILPTRRLLLLLCLPAAAAWLLPGGAGLTALIVGNAVVLAMAGIDLARSPRPGQLHTERILPRRLSLGEWHTITWRIRCEAKVAVQVHLVQELPDSIEAQPPRLAATAAADAVTSVEQRLRGMKRGAFEAGAMHLRMWTRGGLLLRQVRIGQTQPLPVYPGVRGIARYELALRRHQLKFMGVALARRVGQSRTFESLRDYVPGDEPGDVAWKATARRRKLTVRNYELERSQNVMLMVDCGRLMTSVVDGLTRLDHVTNAAMLLAHVAARQGDHIGLLAFSHRLESYMPPMRGRPAVNAMSRALLGLQPRLAEPDYEAACRHLALRHRRRSLLVMFTDVIDAAASSVLLSYAARFARLHLPLCVTLRNIDVEAVASRDAADTDGAFSQAVALDMLQSRQRALEQMRRCGVSILDVNPRELSPALLQRYLDLKMRSRL